MAYENPKIPEGINVTQEHPLKDFLAMLAAVALAGIVVVVILLFVADRMVRLIPFSAERAWWTPAVGEPLTESQQAIEDYLQALTDQLSQAMELPEGMQMTVHYRDDDVINASATLGGHLAVHRGLLQRLDNENALALLLGHEIAHVSHRDPIVAMGRGVTLALVIATLSGVGDDVIADHLLGQIGDLSQLSFSRGQERAADAAGAQAVLRHYGHLQGAGQLFDALRHDQADDPALPLYRTHPLTKQRSATLQEFLQQYPTPGKETALPCTVLALSKPCDTSVEATHPPPAQRH